MIKLQTMPLKFRVWDKENQQFCRERLPNNKTNIKFDILELPLELDMLEEDEKDNFIISQDTGLVDRSGEHIFTGDIIEIVDNGADGFEGDGERLVTAYEDGVVTVVNEAGDFVDYLYNLDPDAIYLIGNIWQNPELLERNNG